MTLGIRLALNEVTLSGFSAYTEHEDSTKRCFHPDVADARRGACCHYRRGLLPRPVLCARLSVLSPMIT